MKLIVANWKMNPQTLKQAQKLVSELDKVKTKSKVVICPPAVFLPILKTRYDLGAQDIASADQGAFTGQLSGAMLKQFKAKYVIVGHSEMRSAGQTDNDVNKKLISALKQKLIPILCVGYGIEASESEDDVLTNLKEQLEQDLEQVDPKKVIIAYEPVWAIGSGTPASPEHAERAAMFIRIKFKAMKVLYGGSTNALNFRSFLRKEIDGLLVGGASLKPEEFKQMII